MRNDSPRKNLHSSTHPRRFVGGIYRNANVKGRIMHYRHANRIIKPKPYTPAIYSDISKTLRDMAPMHPVKLATVVLKYPIREKK